MHGFLRTIQILLSGLLLLQSATVVAQPQSSNVLPEIHVGEQNVLALVDIAEFAPGGQSVSLDDAYDLVFTTLKPADIALGVTDEVYWIRFVAVNRAARENTWVLHGDSNYLDNLRVFYRDVPDGDADVFQLAHLSDRQPFATRPLNYRKLAFEHTTPPDSATEIYLAVSFDKADAMRLDFTVYDSAYFYERVQIEYLLLGAWYGVLLILFSAAVIIAVVMYQPSAWYYAAFLFSTAVMWGLLNGVGFQYVWPDNVYLQNEGFHLSYLFFAFFAFQFSRSFLRLADHLPRANRWMMVAQSLMCVAVLMRLFGVYEWVLVLSYLALMSSLVLPVLGYVVWRRGMRHARWFTLAWMVYSITLLLAVLNVSVGWPGWHMSKVLTIVQIGSMIEVVLLMVAIGERVLQIEQDRRAALDMAHRDPLTGLGNRRRLVQSYERLTQRFISTGQPVFVCLIDMDEFKEINDRYGHDAGDKVLMHLTALLKQHSRGEDTCIRYGGDEFVMLVQAENVEGAHQLVERIRTRFADRPTLFKTQLIRHTVSAGVITVMDAERRLSPAEMLMRVDKALYEAKGRGRNCTIVHA